MIDMFSYAAVVIVSYRWYAPTISGKFPNWEIFYSIWYQGLFTHHTPDLELKPINRKSIILQHIPHFMDESLYGGTPAGEIRKTFSRPLDGLNGPTRERLWQTLPSFSECQTIKRTPQHPKPNPNHMSYIIQHILELFDLISCSPAPSMMVFINNQSIGMIFRGCVTCKNSNRLLEHVCCCRWR